MNKIGPHTVLRCIDQSTRQELLYPRPITFNIEIPQTFGIEHVMDVIDILSSVVFLLIIIIVLEIIVL